MRRGTVRRIGITSLALLLCGAEAQGQQPRSWLQTTVAARRAARSPAGGAYDRSAAPSAVGPTSGRAASYGQASFAQTPYGQAVYGQASYEAQTAPAAAPAQPALTFPPATTGAPAAWPSSSAGVGPGGATIAVDGSMPTPAPLAAAPAIAAPVATLPPAMVPLAATPVPMAAVSPPPATPYGAALLAASAPTAAPPRSAGGPAAHGASAPGGSSAAGGDAAALGRLPELMDPRSFASFGPSTVLPYSDGSQTPPPNSVLPAASGSRRERASAPGGSAPPAIAPPNPPMPQVETSPAAAAPPAPATSAFDDLLNSSGLPPCDPVDPGMPGWFRTRSNCGPWFVSTSGLIMTRDAANNVELAFLQTAPQIAVLNSEQAGDEWTGGVETRIGRRIGDRWAAEFVYWMLDPMESNIGIRTDANLINSRLDTQNAVFSGVPLSFYFNDSHEQRVHRVNEFHNFEWNLMQQALAVDDAGRFGMTMFSGVRYFRYREAFDYAAVSAGAEFADNDPATQAGYHLRLYNHLVGMQLGTRAQLFVGRRLRLFAMPRVGVMTNYISQRNELCMVIDVNSKKTDVAMLGQLDLGFAYQLFNCCSFYGGYRAMGIAGVANADDNIARTFTSIPAMASINSSGSLILHGAQVGLQLQF